MYSPNQEIEIDFAGPINNEKDHTFFSFNMHR